MGCGTSSPRDAAGLPSVGASPVLNLHEGDAIGFGPRLRLSRFDGIHGAVLDPPPSPPHHHPHSDLLADAALNPFRASSTVVIASSSWNIPDAARSTDSKFAPGAERSDSRTCMRDSAHTVHARALEPSFLHPDPTLRSPAPSEIRCSINLVPSDRVAASGESSLSEQSAANGVVCPEPSLQEWNVMVARKRALAEFHGHTADPDQYGTASVQDTARSHTPPSSLNTHPHVHAACAVWLREIEIIF